MPSAVWSVPPPSAPQVKLLKGSAPLKVYSPPPPTKEPLEWANLVELDLREFDEGPEARKALSKILLESLHTTGFLYLVNHGIEEETVQRHLDIATTLLNIPKEEKIPYEASKAASRLGRYVGFAPQSYRETSGWENNVEHYNFPRFSSEIGDEQDTHIPPMLDPLIPEISGMSKYIHKVLARKLFILLAIALEVDEMTFTDMHTYESKCEAFLRYMQYLPRSQQENEDSKDLYLPGHADWGSFTFLFNQPVTALQIKDPNDEWKWIKFVPNSIIVNVGEGLSALTGGYLKPTVHRVVKPPKDQETTSRVSLLYFMRPYNTHSLAMIPSPVLERNGCKTTISHTMGEYSRLRSAGAYRINHDTDKPGAKTKMFKSKNLVDGDDA